MKFSNKLYDYEIKANEIENCLINEKINYTAKKYFLIVNNYSKEISKIEDEINLKHQNCPIKINELIYNQHSIIKELIHYINQKENNKSISKSSKDSNNIQKHIISFNIISPIKNSDNNSFRIIEPSPVYRKKITINANSSNRINTSYSKSDIINSLEKNEKSIINSSNTYEKDFTLKSYNNKFIHYVPMTEKIKNLNYKFNKFHNIIPSKETYESLKYKLKYKYYKTSFLNSFVSGKNKENKLHKVKRNNSGLQSTNRNSYEKKRNKDNNISFFNENNSYSSKYSGKKRVKSMDNQSFKLYNLKMLDDSMVNTFLDRTNNKSRPKANKYVKNLYFISNEKLDKFQRKLIEL